PPARRPSAGELPGGARELSLYSRRGAGPLEAGLSGRSSARAPTCPTKPVGGGRTGRADEPRLPVVRSERPHRPQGLLAGLAAHRRGQRAREDPFSGSPDLVRAHLRL